MIPRYLFSGSTVGKIVEGHRFASHAFGTLQWIRMSMKGEIGRAEDHDAIEQGRDSSFTLAHVAVPQFQVSAVLRLPVLVEVQQQIQATIQTIVAVPVEVRMNSKLA